MTHSLTDQIKAIQEARKLLSSSYFATDIELDELISKLNDAGSTLAALNLNPDREKRIETLEKCLRLVHDCLKDGIPVEKNDPIHKAILEQANINWDAAISGFASPDELTKTK